MMKSAMSARIAVCYWSYLGAGCGAKIFEFLREPSSKTLLIAFKYAIICNC